MAKKFGFERLAEQAASAVAERVTEWREEEEGQIGDSEIEKLFFLALHARIAFGGTEYLSLVVLSESSEPPKDIGEIVGGVRAGVALFIKPQVKIGRTRVDFIIYAHDHLGRTRPRPGIRKLIVECDGHDFHERTKEQASRDRSRDRAAVLDGMEVMRFTGSELWRDPWGCAEQITDWAARGFG